MCGLHAYDKLNDKSTNASIFCGGRSLPEYYTIDSLVYLCVSINFIDTWLKALENNSALSFCAYQYNMKELSENTYYNTNPNT